MRSGEVHRPVPDWSGRRWLKNQSGLLRGVLSTRMPALCTVANFGPSRRHDPTLGKNTGRPRQSRAPRYAHGVGAVARWPPLLLWHQLDATILRASFGCVVGRYEIRLAVSVRMQAAFTDSVLDQ